MVLNSQTSLCVVFMDYRDSLLALTRPHIKGYYTNLNFTGLEDLHISGSARGSLSALKSGIIWPSLRSSPSSFSLEHF